MNTFTAGNTLIFIYLTYSVFVHCNSINRTGFLTWSYKIGYRIIRTILCTESTFLTFLWINICSVPAH